MAYQQTGAIVTHPQRREQMEDLRRTSIVQATTEVVAERGISGATISLVTERASVSRRAYYQSFAGLSDCLVAIIERTLAEVTSLEAQAFAEAEWWVEGMRGAMAAVLAYFDQYPEVARVCLVESAAGDQVVRERRDRALSEFMVAVVRHVNGQVWHPSPLAPEGLLASVIGIVSTRLVTWSGDPLTDLLGPIMGVLISPFLEPAEVRAEIERCERLARSIRENVGKGCHPGAHLNDDLGASQVPATLLAPRAHRLRACLQFVVQQPGASNHQIGAAAGIVHRAQTSRLLYRLAELGLLTKRPGHPGHPNAWAPTPLGRRVALAISAVPERVAG